MLGGEGLFLIERLQHLLSIGLGYWDGLQSFAFEVENEAVGFVVQYADFLDVNDVGAMAAHQ